MKTKTTDKYLRNFKEDIIIIPYCSLQTLLQCEEPTYYTSGVYGWNTDIYVFDDAYIQTGYRGLVGAIAPDFEIIQAYEKKAQKATRIITNYEKLKKELRKLLNKFIKEVKKS